MIKCEGCNGWIYELGEVPDDNACNCIAQNEKNLLLKEIKELKKKIEYMESENHTYSELIHWLFKFIDFTKQEFEFLKQRIKNLENNNNEKV